MQMSEKDELSDVEPEHVVHDLHRPSVSGASSHILQPTDSSIQFAVTSTEEEQEILGMKQSDSATAEFAAVDMQKICSGIHNNRFQSPLKASEPEDPKTDATVQAEEGEFVDPANESDDRLNLATSTENQPESKVYSQAHVPEDTDESRYQPASDEALCDSLNGNLTSPNIELLSDHIPTCPSVPSVTIANEENQIPFITTDTEGQTDPLEEQGSKINESQTLEASIPKIGNNDSMVCRPNDSGSMKSGTNESELIDSGLKERPSAESCSGLLKSTSSETDTPTSVHTSEEVDTMLQEEQLTPAPTLDFDHIEPDGYSASPDHSSIAATLPPKVDSTTPATSESHNGDTKFTQQANHGGCSALPDHSNIAATLPPKVDSTTPAMSESHNGDTKFTQQAKEEDRGEAVKEREFDRPELFQAIETKELCDNLEVEPQTHMQMSEKDELSDVEPEHVVHDLHRPSVSGTCSHILQSTDSSIQFAVTSTEEEQEILGMKRSDSATAEFAAVDVQKICSGIHNNQFQSPLKASEPEDPKTDPTVQAEEGEFVDPANESDDRLNLATSTENQPESKVHSQAHVPEDTDESRYQPASDEILCDSLSGNLTSPNIELLSDHIPTGPSVHLVTTAKEENQIPFITTDTEGQTDPLEEQGSKLIQINESQNLEASIPKIGSNDIMMCQPNDSGSMKSGTNESELLDSGLKERPSAESYSGLLKSTSAETDTPTSVHTSKEVDTMLQEEQLTPAPTLDFDHVEPDGIAINEASSCSLQKQPPHGSAQIAKEVTVTCSNNDGNADVVYSGKLPDLEQNQARIQSLLQKDSEEKNTANVDQMSEPMVDTQTAAALPQAEASESSQIGKEQGTEDSTPNSLSPDMVADQKSQDHNEMEPQKLIQAEATSDGAKEIVLALLEDLITSVAIADSTTAISGVFSTLNASETLGHMGISHFPSALTENLGDTSTLTSTTTSKAKSDEKTMGGDQDNQVPHPIVESDWDGDYVPSEEEEEDLAIEPRRKLGPSHSESGPGHTEKEGDLNSMLKLSAGKLLETENNMQSEPSSLPGEHNTSKQEVPPKEKEHSEVEDDSKRELGSQGGDQDNQLPHPIVESDWDEDYVPSEEEEEDLAIEPRRKLGPSHSESGPGHTEKEGDLNSMLKLSAGKLLETENNMQSEPSSLPGEHNTSKQEVPPKEKEHSEVEDDSEQGELGSQGGDQDNQLPHPIVESDWDEDYVPSEEEEEDLAIEPRKRLGPSQSSTDHEDDLILKMPGNKSDESRRELGIQEIPTGKAPSKGTVMPKHEAEGYDQEGEALSDASYSEPELDEDYEASEEEEEEEEEEEDLATESQRTLSSTHFKWKPGHADAEGVGDSTSRLQANEPVSGQEKQPKQEAKAILQYSSQDYDRDVPSSQKRGKRRFLSKYKANTSIRRNVLIPSTRHECTGDTDDETRYAGLQARPVVYEFVEEVFYIYKSR